MHCWTKRTAIVLAILAALVAATTAAIVAYIVVSANATFLLVETERIWRTELVSGNYTDGEICFDFPKYYIDRENHRLEDWVGDWQSGFDLVYGSSSYASGLASSGGASGLDYVRSLPFAEEERIPWGQSEFNITILVTEDLKVLINGSIHLGRGQNITYDFDQVIKYHNRDVPEDDTANLTCSIRYIQHSSVTNYGIWKLKDIDFQNEDGFQFFRSRRREN